MTFPRHRDSAQRGLTLVELLIVVAIVGVTASLAVGMGDGWRQRQHFNAVTREVFGALSVARSEAQRRNRTVTVRVEPDALRAFIDHDGDGELDVGEQLVRSITRDDDAFEDSISLTSSFATAHGAPTCYLDGRGFCLNAAGHFQAGAVGIRHSDLGAYAEVVVSVSGALRIHR